MLTPSRWPRQSSDVSRLFIFTDNSRELIYEVSVCQPFSEEEGMATVTKRMLTVEEFAAWVGWKPSTVRNKVWRREVEFVRMGRSIRFKRETAERLIEESTIPVLESR